MPPRRSDLLLGVGGAAAGAAITAVWAGGVRDVATAAALGAALGASRRYPRATWLAAVVILLLSAAQARLPGDHAFTTYLLLAAHAFCAGRWDPHWRGLAGPAALICASFAAMTAAGESRVASVFIPIAAWGAAWALRERELIAAELTARARELEEEREAHAALSVRYERARIASELHDIVAHAISIMVVQAGAGQRLAPRSPGGSDERAALCHRLRRPRPRARRPAGTAGGGHQRSSRQRACTGRHRHRHRPAGPARPRRSLRRHAASRPAHRRRLAAARAPAPANSS